MKTVTATFTGPRYSTSEISADIPLDLQLLLWGLIDQLKTEGTTYKSST
ncbi:MAG: hypothetical protein KGZ53_00600 [Peptococcaceae bacterium]|nr:hypothetical protein [Peptococcaceae bacterium]